MAFFVVACSGSPASVCADHGASIEALLEARELGWSVSEPLSVPEIEAEELETLRRYAELAHARKDVPMVPFGFANKRWQEFKATIQPGDEIRRISSPSVCWDRLSGWQGLVLIRNGRVVSRHMTLIN